MATRIEASGRDETTTGVVLVRANIQPNAQRGDVACSGADVALFTVARSGAVGIADHMVERDVPEVFIGAPGEQ